MTIYSHMNCPFCQSSTQVYNSRRSHNSTQTWRRRRCRTCKKSFTTRERVDFSGSVLVSKKDKKRPYSRDRLFLSIVKASNNLELPPEMLSELTDSIEQKLQACDFFNHDIQDHELIIEASAMVLSQYDKNLAIQYINNVYTNKPPLEIITKLLSR